MTDEKPPPPPPPPDPCAYGHDWGAGTPGVLPDGGQYPRMVCSRCPAELC